MTIYLYCLYKISVCKFDHLLPYILIIAPNYVEHETVLNSAETSLSPFTFWIEGLV